MVENGRKWLKMDFRGKMVGNGFPRVVRHFPTTIRHGVEHRNDLTDGVVTRRDDFLITSGVGDHIGRIHIVEHEGGFPEEDIHGSDVGIPILVGVDPGERAIPR